MAAKFSAICANYNNLPAIDTECTIRIKRERRGLCGGCGTRTSLIRLSLAGKEYIPLTIDGVVHHGRCLYCYPDRYPSKISIERNCNKSTERNYVQIKAIPVTAPLITGRHVDESCEDDFVDEYDNPVVYFPEPSAPPEELVMNQSNFQVCENRSPTSYLISHQETIAHNNEREIDRKKSLLDQSMSRSSKDSRNILFQGAHNDHILIQSKQKKEDKRIKDILIEMRESANSPTVQGNVCRKLIDLIFFNSHYRGVIGNLGGASIILHNMEIHSNNSIVLQHTCAVLMILAHKSNNNRNIITSLNGVHIISQAMNMHSADLDLICVACGALWSLSYANARIKNAIGETGIIPFILSIIERHMNELKLHEWTMGLLSTISTEGSNQKLILRNDGLRVIILLLQNHSEDEKILRYSCNLINCFNKDQLSELVNCNKKVKNILENATRSSDPHCVKIQEFLNSL